MDDLFSADKTTPLHREPWTLAAGIFSIVLRLSVLLGGLFGVSNPLSATSSLSSLTRDRVDVQLIVTESGEQDVDKLEYQKPAYVAVALIMGLTFFAVVFPIFVRSQVLGMLDNIYDLPAPPPCQDPCRITIAESIPENLTFAVPVESISTYHAWKQLINSATESIDIAVFYWTLRGEDIYDNPTAKEGEDIFSSLKRAVQEGKIKLRIAQNQPSPQQPQNESRELQKLGAEVRNLNFSQWFNGNGILHTKLWIVDGKHFYVGSANMDWRSLTQVKEMGAVVRDCPCLASDVAKLFSVYWYLGAEPDRQIPASWPDEYETRYNAQSPIQVTLNKTDSQVFISSSPAEFCPKGRTSDIDSILHVIESAHTYIYIAVMDYFPTTLYTRPKRYWPVIDDALRLAAFDRGVEVRILASWWSHSRRDIRNFLHSLQALNGTWGAKGTVRFEVKLFHVPATAEESKIPFARVNHNKYMVTDNTAYIGTSNWSGDYFDYTGGLGLIINQSAAYNMSSDSGTNGTSSFPVVQQQLSRVFERDWNSDYALPVDDHFTTFDETVTFKKEEL